jgi:hypothetical protein
MRRYSSACSGKKSDSRPMRRSIHGAVGVVHVGCERKDADAIDFDTDDLSLLIDRKNIGDLPVDVLNRFVRIGFHDVPELADLNNCGRPTR